MRIYKRADQDAPPPRPVAPGVVMRFDGVYEVDPELMGRHFKQLRIERWDVDRIIQGRDDHLAWMHTHFAMETLYAGDPSELEDEPG